MGSQLPDDTNNETLDAVGLWGECGEFNLPASLWLALLSLAQLYRWTPAGTNPPDEAVVEFDGRGRDGSYFPPNCQIMTREDAQRFAQALEQALLDIPETPESTQRLLFAPWERHRPNHRSVSWSV